MAPGYDGVTKSIIKELSCPPIKCKLQQCTEVVPINTNQITIRVKYIWKLIKSEIKIKGVIF